MHAIIRQDDDKYYVSAVFGYYRDVTATEDYKRYISRRADARQRYLTQNFTL